MLHDTSVSCLSILEELKSSYPPVSCLYLSFHTLIVEVQTSREDIAELLIQYFHPFVIAKAPPSLVVNVFEAEPPKIPGPLIPREPDPGKEKIKEEYLDLPDGRLVRKRQTGMVFVFSQGVHLAIGSCLENLNQVINFINNRFIERKILDGALLGHAAAVSYKGNGMAIAGFSGMGKSTLALHLLNHGATFVTNDRLLVEARKQELTMYGVAKLPRINPGTALNNSALTCLLSSSEREEFSTLSQEDLWQVEYKYDVPIDKCFGQGRFELGGTMSELIILNWHYLDKRCQMTEVSIASRYDLLEAFWKNPGLFFLNHEGQTIDLSFDRYAEMLSCCRVFEITGGIDFQKASQQCMDIMHAAY